jgi:hypothetical protein
MTGITAGCDVLARGELERSYPQCFHELSPYSEKICGEGFVLSAITKEAIAVSGFVGCLSACPLRWSP